MPPMHEAELLEREHELTALDALVEATQAGDGRLLVIEGPAGIGKTRLLAEARARRPSGACASSRRGAASSSASSPFGVVRQLFERRRAPAPTATSARFDGRGRAGARQCSAARLRRGHGRRRRLVRRAARPLLAGPQPRRRAAAAAGGRRPPLVRPPVAALPRLPRAPARGAAGARGGHAAHAASRAPTRRCSPSSPARSARRASRPGPLSARPAWRSRRASGSGADADPRVRAPPATRRRAATRCCSASSSRRSRPTGCRPTPATPSVVRELGPARRVARGAAAARAAAGTRRVAVARAVAVLGEGAGCRRSRRWPDSTRPAWPTRRARSLGRRSCGPTRRSASSTRSYATPSTTTCRPASASSGTPARPRVLLDAGRAARAGRGAPAADRRRAARRGWSTLLRAAGRSALHKGAAESAVAYLRRALAEPSAARRAGRRSLRAGRGARCSTAAGRRPSTCARRYDAADRPAGARAGGRDARAHADVHRRPPRRRQRSPARPRAELPPELRRPAPGARGVRARRACSSAPDEPEAMPWLAEHRAGIEGDGPGAQMLAARGRHGMGVRAAARRTSASSWRCARSPAASCSPPTTACCSVAPIIVLALADRDEALETSEAALADAHRRGSLFSTHRRLHLWHGFDAHRARRPGRGRGRRCARGSTSSPAGGSPSRRWCTRPPFLADVLLERGDLAGARGRSRPRRRSRRPVRRGPLLAQQRDGAADRRGPRRGRGRDGRRVRTALLPLRQPGVRALAHLQGAGPRPPGASRRGHRARRGGARAGARLGRPGPGRARAAVLGTLGGTTASTTCGRRSRCSTARPRASSSPRRWRRSARRCGAFTAPTDAREPLRRALELATRAAATAPGRARAGRAPRRPGARPRRDAASGVESLTAERAARRRPRGRRRDQPRHRAGRSSSRRRPSRSTSPTPTASSASALGASSRGSRDSSRGV